LLSALPIERTTNQADTQYSQQAQGHILKQLNPEKKKKKKILPSEYQPLQTQNPK
jgi:hypothetical protein